MVKSDLQVRSYSLFLSANKSEHTKEIYVYHLEKFLAWNKDCKDYDDLLKADEKAIQRKLEDYVMYLKLNFSSNYIPTSPPDLDCGDIPQKRFTVLPPDPHRFDGDKDGVGCES